jgi:hypothetical protein
MGARDIKIRTRQKVLTLLSKSLGGEDSPKKINDFKTMLKSECEYVIVLKENSLTFSPRTFK